MNLQVLNASTCSCNITDNGIKHMNLRKLNASYNTKITDNGMVV